MYLLSDSKRFLKAIVFTMALVNPSVSTIDRNGEKVIVDNDSIRNEKEQSIEQIQGRS